MIPGCSLRFAAALRTVASGTVPLAPAQYRSTPALAVDHAIPSTNEEASMLELFLALLFSLAITPPDPF